MKQAGGILLAIGGGIGLLAFIKLIASILYLLRKRPGHAMLWLMCAMEGVMIVGLLIVGGGGLFWGLILAFNVASAALLKLKVPAAAFR